MDHIYSNTIEDARFIRSQFENLGTKMYYSTHPDSSWERGQNESR
jgi:IS30 family transposase